MSVSCCPIQICAGSPSWWIWWGCCGPNRSRLPAVSTIASSPMSGLFNTTGRVPRLMKGELFYTNVAAALDLKTPVLSHTVPAWTLCWSRCRSCPGTWDGTEGCVSSYRDLPVSLISVLYWSALAPTQHATLTSLNASMRHEKVKVKGLVITGPYTLTWV